MNQTFQHIPEHISFPGMLRAIYDSRKGTPGSQRHARGVLERMDSRVRMDAAPLISGQISLVEQFVRVFEKADEVPLPPTPCLENWPIEGPGEYPFAYDTYKRYIVRSIGKMSDATGAESDAQLITISSTPLQTKAHLRAIDYEWTWISQRRAAVIDFDQIGHQAQGARTAAALYHELGYLYGHTGIPGFMNSPSVRKYYNTANGAGSTLMGSSTDTEIFEAFKAWMSKVRADNLIDAYDPDEIMIPRWLKTRLVQGVVNIGGAGGTVTAINLEDAILKYNSWIKKIVENPRLDYRDENGGDTSGFSGDNKISLMACYRNDTNYFHQGQPIPFEELPMWQSSPNTYKVRAYASHTGAFFRKPQPCWINVC